ncbi:MAG: MurR/RpiR family transcriptional regulator [Pseudomonadota bacterium]
MNGTDVSSDVLHRLAEDFEDLTPEAQKAAKYVLENPRAVGVSTVRQMADAASVKPNTLVRMARQMGYEGYEEFRQPFRDAIRTGEVTFPDRVRFLQEIQRSGQLGELYAGMVQAALRNIEETFAGITADALTAAGRAIWASRNVFTLGVGVNNANARNFTYLAATGMVQFHAIPRAGSVATDDLAWSDARDVLIAITCAPYRSEVIDAVAVAREQGVQVIGITDSLASPIYRQADHGFVVAAETPQFFPSSVSTIALLEVLLSFTIAQADSGIVARVEAFHDRRHRLGLYDGAPP